MSRQAPYPGGPSPQGSLPGAQRSRYRRNRAPGGTHEVIRHHVRPGGRVIVSVPNVAHLSVRLPLLVGRFEYRDTGILNRTHLHFYTYRSASELVESAGLRVSRSFAGSNHFGRLLNRSPIVLRILGGCLAYNIVLLCTPATPCLSTEHGRQP